MFGRRVLTRRRRRLSLLSAVAVAVAALPAVPSFVGSAQAAMVTVEANADATVDEANPGTNLGAETTLLVDGRPPLETYVRFPAAAASGTVSRATLRLHVVNSTSDAPTVHLVTGSWSEGTITWNNRPTPAATAVADAGAARSGDWLEYDVTDVVAANTPVSFALKPEVTDGIDFDSRNASGNRPHLVVETGTTPAPPATATFAPSADARVEEDDPQTNFGSDDQLANQDDPDPLIDSYLRFDVAGLGSSVRKATLRLRVTGSGDGPSVRPTGGSWTEGAITWSNRPAPTGDAVGNFGTVSRGWEELDVTPLVKGNGAVNLLLTGGSDDSVQIRSREGDPEDRPQLVVETGSTSSTTATTSSSTTTTRPPTTTTTTRPSRECDDSWDSADNIGKLPSGRGEMSGLVASSANPGWGWGVRDSGNPAALYSFRIGSGGNITSDEFLVPGASNSDWEDAVYTRTSTGAGRLWVLDNVGNAHGGNRRIYEIAEPDPDRPGNAQLLQRYDWAYPDAQYNSEVLFLFDGDLAVISKTKPSRVYRFFEPLRAGVVNRPTFVGVLPTGSNLSVASMSPDDRFMVVASHSSMYVYENNGTLDDLGDLIADSPVFSQKPPSDNRESGGFFPYGSCDIVLVAESKNVWRSSQ